MLPFDEDEIKGSSFLFFIFRAVNIVMMILGILVIVASVYVYLLLQSFTNIDFGIICIGLFIIAISYFSFSLKDTLGGLTAYIVATLIYLFCQLIACTMIASAPENVVAYIISKANPKVQESLRPQVQSHVKTVQYLMVLMLLATVFAFR